MEIGNGNINYRRFKRVNHGKRNSFNDDYTDKCILIRVQEHFEEANQVFGSGNQRVFVTVLQGSQNYGLQINNEEYQSDIDTKSIILPSFRDFCNNTQPISTTHMMPLEEGQENPEHNDFKDIRVMFETFKKQNVNFMEILFSDYFVVSSYWHNEWQELRSLADDLTACHPKQTVRTMAGMSMEKYKALEHLYPTIKWKIDKWGYDGKQLHHIIRIHDFINRYIDGVPFRQCLIPSNYVKNMLMEAKLNHYTLDEARSLAERLNAATLKAKDAFIMKDKTELLTDEPYKKLDNLKVRILAKCFGREIANANQVDNGNLKEIALTKAAIEEKISQ